MRKEASSQLISQFFGDDVELFEFNIIIVLDFLLSHKSHKKIVKNILSVSMPGTSFHMFKQVVTNYKKEIESSDNLPGNILGKKIQTSGTVLKTLKSSPVRWLFIALYWAYNFRDNSFEYVRKIYDDRIGNIPLLFLLKKNKMQKMEMAQGLDAYPLKFYTDLAVRVVRAIEILTQMSLQNNTYINRTYLKKELSDIVANFFMTISSSRWESHTLSIAESKECRVIKYHNVHYGIELITPTTRMLKDGFLSEPEDTYREWIQLVNLEPKNAGTRISHGGSRKKRKEKIYDEIDGALIPVTMVDPSILNKEETIESENRSPSSRSIYFHTNQKNIPSSIMQHRQNKTFSSTVTKSNIYQPSDYDVPPPSILIKYCKALNDTTLSDKFFKSLFLIAVCIGCKTEDIIDFFADEKQNAFKLKDTTLLTHIETDFFAKKKLSDLFVHTGATLSFSLPTRLAMLMNENKRNHQAVATQEFELWFQRFSFSPNKPINYFFLKKTSIKFFTPKDRLLINYTKYLVNHTKVFDFKITIKPSKTYRYLFHYIASVGGDLRTAKMAAVVHNRNDRSRLAYTSSRKNATLHSQYIKEFWLALDFDSTSDGLLSIPIDTYKTSITEFAITEYTGSNLLVKSTASQIFFTSLLMNIENSPCETDRFNLISVYVRYTLSLLAGTREFSNSGNFQSWSKKLNMLSINEKSTSLSMGIRYIPLNSIISNILNFYQDILQKRGLSNNVYLFYNNSYSVYSAGDATLIIEDMPNLSNKDTIKNYVSNVPLNAGRHIFTCKALDQNILQSYIDAFLGHYGKGEEQLGTYSCLNLRSFHDHIQSITTDIAIEHGIKDLK